MVYKKQDPYISFATQLNLTHNPGRSSLVQFCFGFVYVDGSTSTSTSSVKNQGIGRVSDKRKMAVHEKYKHILPLQVLLQQY